MEEKKYNITFP